MSEVVASDVNLVCRLCGVRSLTSKKGDNYTLIDLYSRGVGLFTCFLSDLLAKQVGNLEEGEEYEFSFKLCADNSKNLVCKLQDFKF